MFVDREWLNELDIPIIKKAAKFITLFFDMRELAAKPETTIQDLLWAAFQRSQMKKVWPHQAMVVEEVGLQTARNLDAVVALFGAAARYVERNPKGEAIEFVRQQLALRLPEDSIGVGANLEHRVSLVTPSGLIGRHYRVLAIAHLQEGIWPNLRPRSSLLKATALDELVRTNADKVEARQSQNEMPGELRMLAKAIGATGERLYLSAIATEEEQPSQFFELVAQHVPEASELTETPLTMRAMAGRLRKELVREGDPVRRQVIAAQLVRLAAAGAPGADPAQWWGLAKPTTDEPLAELGLGNKDSNALVIKPSELESFARCPLHWFIEAHGGSSYSFKTRVGDLMHEILELPGAPDRDRYFEVVESKWPELEFDSNWQERHERERVTLMVNRLYNYLNQYEADGNQKVYAEESFEFEIGGAHVKGRADRIEVLKDGSLRVADLKTSKYSVKVKDVPNHQQLGAYQLAVLNNAFPKIAEAISEPILEGAQLIEIGAKDPVGDPLLEQADLKPQASLQVDLTAREQMVGEITEAIQGMLMQQGFLVAKAGEHCRSDYSFGSCEIHLIEQVTYGD
ncbi:MAG: PD-(D/E)XK nuclease family protein [Micrococcales bacterium]